MLAESVSPGQIFRLPAWSTDLEDWEAHYHLAVKVHTQDSAVTVLFGTSSDAESRCGAPSVVVDSRDPSRLTKTTYFYGSVIAVARLSRFGRPAADISSRMLEIKQAIKDAIGYRAGLSYGSRSERGRVVQFKPKYEKLYGTKYCAILTSHDYSYLNNYQVFAPLYDVAPQTTTPVASVPMPAALARLFSNGASSLYMPASIVRSLWSLKVIDWTVNTGRTIDTNFLEAIEDALCSWLDI